MTVWPTRRAAFGVRSPRAEATRAISASWSSTSFGSCDLSTSNRSTRARFPGSRPTAACSALSPLLFNCRVVTDFRSPCSTNRYHKRSPRFSASSHRASISLSAVGPNGRSRLRASVISSSSRAFFSSSLAFSNSVLARTASASLRFASASLFCAFSAFWLASNSFFRACSACCDASIPK